MFGEGNRRSRPLSVRIPRPLIKCFGVRASVGHERPVVLLVRRARGKSSFSRSRLFRALYSKMNRRAFADFTGIVGAA